MRLKSICLLIGLFVIPFRMEAQFVDKVIDFLTVYPNKKAAEADSTIYKAKAILTPIVSFDPETSLSIGVGMKGLFKLKGSGPETRTSNLPLSAQYTINGSYVFFSGFQIFFPEERYILAGNLRVQSFPSYFFGVGKNTPDSNEEKFSYSQVLFEPILLKNVFIPKLYIGSGVRFNKISNVGAVTDGLLENSGQSGALGSTSSGLQLALIYDTRDNLLNAKEGIYFAVTRGFYKKVLGGTQQYGLSRFDFRYYTGLFNNPWSTLAFQVRGQFSHGDTPLLELGRLGGDDIMRGYFEGRFTDKHLLVTQVEFRQRLNRRWGVTAFVGVGGVAPSLDQFTLNGMHPAGGIGLRFLIDNVEDLNLRFDYALGQNSKKYYFKIAEAF